MGSCIEERKKRAEKRERKKKEENQQLNSVKPSSNLVKFRRWCGRDWTIIKTGTTHRWSR